MPLPGHEPFLQTICADPENDTPRLAYADWLDEQGDEGRAEFVRVQCRLASLGHGPMWPHDGTANPERITVGLKGEAVALVRRQAELWEAHRDEWQAELPDVPGSTILYHRGFAAATVTEHPGGLVRDGARLFALAPVTRVTFRDCRPEAIEVCVGRGWFGAVRGLMVTGDGGNRVAEILGECSHFVRLRDLSLFKAKVTNVGAHAIGVAPFIRRLVKLNLAGNRVRDAGALSVARGVDPERLAVLDLSGNPLTRSCRLHLVRKLGDRVCVEGGEEPEG